MQHRFAHTLIILVTALIGTLPAVAYAGAETVPLLLRQLETEIGGTREEVRRGITGSIHALGLQSEAAGPQSIQVAVDGFERPTLVRVAQVVDRAAAATAFAGSSVIAVELVRTAPLDSVQPQIETAVAAITDFALSPTSQVLNLPLPDGTAMTLTLNAGTRVALFDIPVTRPVPTLLDGASVASLLSDATAVTRMGTLYHMPDGRLIERRADGSLVYGAWRAEDATGYCLERSPSAGFTCYDLYQEDRDRAIRVARDMAPGGALSVDILFGNPDGLPIAQRGDAISSDVATRLVRGKTEGWIAPDGARRILYLAPDGSFRGVEGGDPSTGVWSVLSDGRLCLVPETKPFTCAFLSETDGGTFRHFAEDRTLLGEAQYTDGNPNGYSPYPTFLLSAPGGGGAHPGPYQPGCCGERTSAARRLHDRDIAPTRARPRCRRGADDFVFHCDQRSGAGRGPDHDLPERRWWARPDPDHPRGRRPAGARQSDAARTGRR